MKMSTTVYTAQINVNSIVYFFSTNFSYIFYCFLIIISVVMTKVMMVHSSSMVEEGKNLINAEELEPPVQGPINREPDEKLFPERFEQKESGIRKL